MWHRTLAEQPTRPVKEKSGHVNKSIRALILAPDVTSPCSALCVLFYLDRLARLSFDLMAELEEFEGVQDTASKVVQHKPLQ